MPKFFVMVKHTIEEYAEVYVFAKDAAEAQEKIEAQLESTTWEVLSKKFDVQVDVDELTVDEVNEA